MVDNEYILAIDIGGTSIKIGVVKQDNVIENTSTRNVFKGKSNQFIKGIKDFCNIYINKYNITKIGIGCPGDIINGKVETAANLGWKNYNILEDFQNNFPDLEIKICNDGLAAFYGEKKYGKLKDIDNAIFITLGRGVGGAILMNNQIVIGSHLKGGKIGHMIINRNGRRCNCGRRGCLETYASVLGLINTVKEYNMHTIDENSKISDEKLSGYQIVQYAKGNNKMVLSAIRKWNYDIAEGILNLCNLFDPQRIVIAGGITESDLIDLELIKTFINNRGYEQCEVYLTSFKGKTGLIGAAANFDFKLN